MNKRYTPIVIVLLVYMLLFAWAIWFGIGMSPGGNFSGKRGITEIKPSPQVNEDSTLQTTLEQYAQEMNKMEINSLKNITTEKGFRSLLDWSDSLQNKEFITSLSDLLLHFEVYNIIESDSSITLSLGEPNEIVGATGGYLFLKKVNNELKINQYRGGK